MSHSAQSVVRKPAVKEERVVDTVTLDHQAREHHHRNVTTAKGMHLHIHLHGVGALKIGDALKLEDGGLVRIAAAEEKLLEIRVENSARLARLAWRLGGEHVPMEASADALYVPAHPAIEELIRGQGATYAAVTRAFEPERAVHHHHHDHGHDHHGHDHHHDHHHGHHHHDHSHDAHGGHKHDHHHDHAHGHDHGGHKS